MTVFEPVNIFNISLFGLISNVSNIEVDMKYFQNKLKAKSPNILSKGNLALSQYMYVCNESLGF